MSTIVKKDFKLKNGIIITIGTAEPKDASGIIDVMKNVMKEKVFTIYEIDEYKNTIEKEIKRIKEYKKAPGKIIITASDKNHLIGFATFNNWDARKTMHAGFLSVYLLKKYRRMGIGKELMRTLISWGKSCKTVRKMCLAVFSCNKNAIALYQDAGFKIEGVCPKDIKINGRYYDSVLMYKFTN